MMRRDNINSAFAIHYSADVIHRSDPVANTAPVHDRSTFFYNAFREVWVMSLDVVGCDSAPSAEFVGNPVDGDTVVSLPRMRRYAEGSTLVDEATSWPGSSA